MNQAEFEHELLQSGRSHRPDAARRAAARAALMATASVSVAASASFSAKWLAFAKWFGLSALGGAFVAGVAWQVMHSRPEHTEPPAASHPAPPAAPRTPHTTPALTVDEPPATVPPARSGARPRAVAAPVEPEEIDPLAAEAHLLEGARRCLTMGDRGCATARLDEYALRFPHGALAPEAAVLRKRLGP